jgi:hypothetical protein
MDLVDDDPRRHGKRGAHPREHGDECEKRPVASEEHEHAFYREP